MRRSRARGFREVESRDRAAVYFSTSYRNRGRERLRDRGGLPKETEDGDKTSNMGSALFLVVHVSPPIHTYIHGRFGLWIRIAGSHISEFIVVVVVDRTVSGIQLDIQG